MKKKWRKSWLINIFFLLNLSFQTKIMIDISPSLHCHHMPYTSKWNNRKKKTKIQFKYFWKTTLTGRIMSGLKFSYLILWKVKKRKRKKCFENGKIWIKMNEMKANIFCFCKMAFEEANKRNEAILNFMWNGMDRNFSIR